jgi:hypothetical protein
MAPAGRDRLLVLVRAPSTGILEYCLSNAEAEAMGKKELRRIALGRSDELRWGWKEEIKQFVAEDLVFLGKSICNEKTE